MIAMLQALRHVSLRSTDLSRTLGFYQRLLGMEPGPGPASGLPVGWLHVDGRPVLHVLELPPEGGSGVIDHVAFEACNRAVLSARLAAEAVPFKLVALPDGSALQMFLRDPDGARIELVFRHPEDR